MRGMVREGCWFSSGEATAVRCVGERRYKPHTLQSSGVIKMAPIVVHVVMRTESATSPLAMYVHRLEAWPPLMEPTVGEREVWRATHAECKGCG